jgi:hypothetical protein
MNVQSAEPLLPRQMESAAIMFRATAPFALFLHRSFEISLTQDYVTDALWHALEAGCLPIYLGAPNISVRRNDELL